MKKKISAKNYKNNKNDHVIKETWYAKIKHREQKQKKIKKKDLKNCNQNNVRAW